MCIIAQNSGKVLNFSLMSKISISLVVEGKKHPNPEKNGRELNLVSIDAEFPIGRHIQNPLNSSIGKKNYNIF